MNSSNSLFFMLFRGQQHREEVNMIVVWFCPCVSGVSFSLLQDSDVVYVPCSGLTGENLVGPCEEPLLLKWYNGPSLLDRIGTSA